MALGMHDVTQCVTMVTLCCSMQLKFLAIILILILCSMFSLTQTWHILPQECRALVLVATTCKPWLTYTCLLEVSRRLPVITSFIASLSFLKASESMQVAGYTLVCACVLGSPLLHVQPSTVWFSPTPNFKAQGILESMLECRLCSTDWSTYIS